MRSLFALITFSLFCLWSPLAAAPKRQAGVKPTQCATCHGDAKVLPAGHTDLRKGPPPCAACHERTGPTSLRAKLPLAHRHALEGVDCAACHGKGKPAKAPATVCLGCHDLAALIVKTAGAAEHNPHEDQHGYSKNCNLCHHAHRPATNHCSTCHAFNWQVP